MQPSARASGEIGCDSGPWGCIAHIFGEVSRKGKRRPRIETADPTVNVTVARLPLLVPGGSACGGGLSICDSAIAR